MKSQTNRGQTNQGQTNRGQTNRGWFHFTIGPVQGFVAQARRTRDFWAGSFLLSWLAGVAMREVMAQHGGDAKVIKFPHPDPAFIAALSGPAADGPQQGTIPNRFMAEVHSAFVPERVPQAVLAAWTALGDLIWNADNLASIAEQATQVIWRRQLLGFWEMSWAFGETRDESDVLDRRKNLRDYQAPAEPGIKCMLMDGWQELSGAVGPGDPALKRFWEKLRATERHGIATDLRPGEHLCAMAYIKRRFVRHFHALKAQTGQTGWQVHGWSVPASLPSISYMAAAHWLEAAIDASTGDSARKALWDFHDAAKNLLKGRYPEATTSLRCIESALQRQQIRGSWKWTSLDGDVFFEHALLNPREFADSPARDHPRGSGNGGQQADATPRALKRLQHQTRLPPPSPFYALLLMDGDNLGQHMSQPERQGEITAALQSFTNNVKARIEEHSGYLIFAGGDDVLALLPLEDALPAAAAFHQLYADCFARTKVPSTLSGAIEYAHVKMPLTRVIRDAHDLLDRVAKDGRGRDAIACRVWKPGGQALEWAMPWTKALTENHAVKLHQLADEFRERDRQTPFANRFFYRIRERLETFAPCPSQAGGLTEDQTIALMAAEYLGSGVNERRTGEQKLSFQAAGEIITPLLDQCRIWSRSGDALMAADHWPADGALLVRFLAQKGVKSKQQQVESRQQGAESR